MGKVNYKHILREKKCDKCKKIFLAAPMHRYKAHNHYYCSWTCYLHRDDWEV